MTILYYPQNTSPGIGRIPLSLLALGAVLEHRHDYMIVDGNVDRNALSTLRSVLQSSHSSKRVLAVSVMPGMQMLNAIRHCKLLKQEFPDVLIVWGGYFPSMHTDAVCNSSYVDYVVRGQAERSLPELLQGIESGNDIGTIHNLSYKKGDKIHHNPEYPLFDPNDRPLLPYHRISMESYAIQTFIGKRTLCHESSVGCPHKCNFCGVVDVFHSRWKAEAPERTFEVVRHLQSRYGMDGIEFHDSDFFVSQQRVAALSELLLPLNINWWGEGRIDTLLKYDKETWKLMRRSGLRMIFFGAESGLDETLELMDKGGVTAEKTKEIAALCKEQGMQSEFSFVMGSHPTKTRQDIDATISLMYDLEEINPQSQMHPFIYTPVPFGTIYESAVTGGLAYPKNLDEWATHEWTQYTLRQRPHTPWLTKRLYNRIINFRAVHHAYFPKTNDRQISGWRIALLRLFSSWRYRLRFFHAAYEIRFLLRLLTNTTPASEGF